MKPKNLVSVIRQCFRLSYFLSLIVFFFLSISLTPQPAHAQDSSVTADTQQSNADTDTVSSTVAIRVEDEFVTKKEFNARVESLFKKYRQQAENKGKDFNPEDVRSEIKNKVQKRMVSRLLVKVYTERSDITVPDTQVNKSWNQSLKKAGSKEKLLQKFGEDATPEKAKEQIRFKIKRTLFINKNLPKISVSDTEVMEVYNKNRKNFKRAGKTRALKFIRRKIKEKKKNRASKAYIASLKEKADVEINI